MTTENPVPNSEQGRRQELLGRKDAIWNRLYLKGNFRESKAGLDILFQTAVEWGADKETLAHIIGDRAWSEYFIDKNGTTKTNASYISAKEGLDKLSNLEETPAIHFLRSNLFEVAGLSQAYLLDERDESAEPLFRQSVEEAEKSQVLERVGEAKNGFALWLISPRQKKFEEAIPLFQEVAIAQEGLENKRTAGHAHNNLIICHNETGRFEKAVEEADKALELYGDPNLNHSFSTRFRKSLSLRRLGRFEEALAIYELHKNLRTRDPNISEQDKARLIANEDKNIETTKKEMEKLI